MSEPPQPPPLAPASVRALVFDLDGTLVDSYRAIASSLNHARAHFELPPLSEEFVRARVGRGLESLIAELVGASHVEPGVRLFRERYAELYADQSRALPDVPATLRRLSEDGFPMSVASNKPARFSRPILESLDLLRWFECVAGPDVVGSTKPDPAMILHCLDVMRIPAGSTAYVGDMTLDVESAARSGVSVILITGGSSTREELERTGQVVLEGLGPLHSLLRGRS